MIRGGLTQGPMRHTLSLLYPTDCQGNLVGAAVVDAVNLERSGRGPRLFVSNHFAYLVFQQDRGLAEWILKSTSKTEVWEVLWPLSNNPRSFEGTTEVEWKRWIIPDALLRLQDSGTNPDYGEHYRELVILIAHSAERASKFFRLGRLRLIVATHPSDLLPRKSFDDIVARTPGLPREFVTYTRALLDRL